jgi:Ni/Co efflux regulator RcnB
MKNFSRASRFVVITASLALLAGSAFASKPEGSEDGKHKEHKENKDYKSKEYRKDQDDNDQGNDRRNHSVTLVFSDQERRTVSDYYGHQSRKGHCPSGLIKKKNGCLPPGQAKKWHKGRPIAKDTRYYELPAELRIRLPAPPINHEYVRIAGDILLITVGTGIVVDAIEDILH